MKINAVCLRGLTAIICFLQIILFALPVQAANRNDFLFNLKDTFNSPVTHRSSFGAVIVTVALFALLAFFFFFYSTEQNVRRTKRRLKMQKGRLQVKQINQNRANPQKRNWFRLATRAEFRWLPMEQAVKMRMNRYKIDRLINISGGGICFSTTDSLKTGDLIKIILSTGSAELIILDGRVIRITEGDDGKNVSVEFVGIRDGQRDKIVAWILDRQRQTIHGEKPEKTRLGSE